MLLADGMKRDQSDGFGAASGLLWPASASSSGSSTARAPTRVFQYAHEAWEREDAAEAAAVLPVASTQAPPLPLPLPLPLPPGPAKRKKPAKTSVFACTEPHCGKTFPRSFALRRHARIHTGTKPYACDFDGCAQRFNTSGNLSRHKRIHSGERPYPCIFATCGKRFNTSTKLKRHMRIHFPEGQNLFRCVGGACAWSCDNYKEFAQHQKLHHNVIVGAQLENAGRRAAAAAAAAAASAAASGSSDAHAKDNDYFSVADTTSSRLDYHSQSQSQSQQSQAAMPSYNPAGSFLYGQGSSYASADKPKATRKLMGSFFPSDLGGIPSLPALHKDKKLLDDIGFDLGGQSSSSSAAGSTRRPKPPAPAFPSGSFRPPSAAASSALPFDSYALSSDAGSSYRPSLLSSASSSGYSSHYGGHMRHDNEQIGQDADDNYGQQQQQQQHSGGLLHHHGPGPLPPHLLLRPPPSSSSGEDVKYGGFQVPPPMNPAAPEFTGEELSVVLQLMNENYC